MIGKLRMMRAVADDLGNPEFVVIARTDGLSAVDAPQPERGMDLAIDRGLRYLDSGVPDLLWCEFPTSDREPVETFTTQIRRRFPEARFAFNYSSSFKWFNDPEPMTFSELGEMGVGFIFITLGGQHATGHGLSTLLSAMAERQEQGYIELQRREWEPGADIPTRSHHQFSGVPYHHLVGTAYDAARLGTEFVEALPEEKVV
jgi:isocitrate lyase